MSVTSRGSRRLEEARDELISRVEKSISKDLTSVVSRYFDLVAPEDLVGTEVRDLEGLIKSHVALGQSRTPGISKVQALSPSLDAQGWQSLHSVVQVVTDDMPFLVDSVSAEISQQGRSIRVVIHPRFWVKRDAQGELIEILDRDVLPGESAPDGAIQESWISVECFLSSAGTDLRAAVLIDSEKDLNIEVIGDSATATAPLGNYLVVPDPALIRASALDAVASLCNGGLVNEYIAWLTSDDTSAVSKLANQSPGLASVLKIESRFKFSEKQLVANLKDVSAAGVTVMTRGMQLDVEAIRKLAVKATTSGSQELIIAIYRDDAGPQAFVCRRYRS